MIKVTENLKNFIGDITGLNVKVPSYYRTEIEDKWKDIYVLFKNNTLVIGGGGVDAIMFHKVQTEGKSENFQFCVDKKRFFETTKFYGKDFMIENEENQYLRMSKNSKAVRLIPSPPDTMILSLIEKSFDYFGIESKERLRIKKEEFAVARNFTSDDRIRESLLNVCIRDGIMYGADGHIMCSISIDDPPEELVITQYSPIDFDYDTFVHRTKNMFIFSNDSTVIFQNKITSEYPNVKKIVDSLEGNKVNFKRKDMLYTLRFLSGIGKGGVDISIIEDKAIFKFVDIYSDGIRDQAGDVLTIVNKENIGTHLRFNLTYLTDVIKSLSFENVRFYIPDDYGKPCYVKEKNNTYIIMPVALGE